MSAHPLVTIGIPVKNGANYLREAIQSALGQTYAPIEVLIVDDGSDDDGATWQIIQSFGEQVRSVRQSNKGVSAALNTCIAHMKGEYFSWLSHDDLYSPVKIATQVQYFLDNPEYSGVLFTSFASIDHRGCFVRSAQFDHAYFDSIFYAILATCIHGCSLLIPKKVLTKVGTFDENLKTVCDNDLWLRMAFANIPFQFQPYELVYSRDHTLRATYSLQSTHAKETVLFYVGAIKKLLPFLSGLDPEILKTILASRPRAHEALRLLESYLQAR